MFVSIPPHQAVSDVIKRIKGRNRVVSENEIEVKNAVAGE
ncbi:MAG: hypothetical protein QGF71_03030 [Rhodospirillales bacterium]|nr:hypothetical protein [Rhodospirillales bacterium]